MRNLFWWLVLEDVSHKNIYSFNIIWNYSQQLWEPWEIVEGSLKMKNQKYWTSYPRPWDWLSVLFNSARLNGITDDFISISEGHNFVLTICTSTLMLGSRKISGILLFLSKTIARSRKTITIILWAIALGTKKFQFHWSINLQLCI